MKRYPLGAIRNKTELGLLVERAKDGEQVKIWATIHEGMPVSSIDKVPLLTIILGPEVSFNFKGKGYTNEMFGPVKVAGHEFDRIDLGNTAVLPFGNLRDSTVFLFTNYWHAYAHQQRELKRKDLENE
jgi:hypothetical protein